MNAPHLDQARAVTARLLAACLPQASPEAATDFVTAGFRCWTPLDDWQSGAAGLAALRRAMSVYGTGAEPGSGQFRLQPLVTDGERVVAEASTAGRPGHPPITITYVLMLDSGLVSEVRCYLDPDTAGG
jgi:hypothetical protein